MAWIAKIEQNEAAGELRREYDEAIERAGRVYEILKVQSLKPEYVSASVNLYRSSMFGPSLLTRAQREMIAVVVSAANRCHY